MIARLSDPTHELNPSDFVTMRITQDYFSVFHALSPKIGLLGPLGEKIVLAYSATKALFEDIATLREEIRPYIEGTKSALPDEIQAYLLRATTGVNQHQAPANNAAKAHDAAQVVST
jgi:hypothetical protein